MTFLRIRNVEKSFGRKKAISELSLEVEQNEIIGVLGPSGCGKTTLLRIIAGLEVPDRGEIIINGSTVYSKRTFITPEKRNVGMVFQDFALWPHMTVREHIGFVLESRKIKKDEKISEILRLLYLGSLAGSYPEQLSGGEKQRVAIARVLAQEPRILLLDEPASNLDQILKREFKDELLRLREVLKVTVVYVTHNYLELLGLADKITVMKDGRIIQEGKTDEVYENPGNGFVASLFNK
ncbi:MAG: ABC transporter ATP-binding protein [Candidatus Altiarchaeota archaeon]|nr:ABC transporter ATP-binding protein [Candidatus Altiarchaeota archaeon]